MSAGAYLFLGIFVAAAVRPSFCKIRGDSTCYWASALLEMLFIPSRHHLLLHLIGKRKRTLRLVVNRDASRVPYRPVRTSEDATAVHEPLSHPGRFRHTRSRVRLLSAVLAEVKKKCPPEMGGHSD